MGRCSVVLGPFRLTFGFTPPEGIARRFPAPTSGTRPRPRSTRTGGRPASPENGSWENLPCPVVFHEMKRGKNLRMDHSMTAIKHGRGTSTCYHESPSASKKATALARNVPWADIRCPDGLGNGQNRTTGRRDEGNGSKGPKLHAGFRRKLPWQCRRHPVRRTSRWQWRRSRRESRQPRRDTWHPLRGRRSSRRIHRSGPWPPESEPHGGQRFSLFSPSQAELVPHLR